MVKVEDIIGSIEEWAPRSLAETWDNPGLMTGDPGDPAAKVLIALDVTADILAMAGETPGTLILSHHPVIFKPLSHLTGNTAAVRIVREAVRRDIAVYSAHTNLDRAPGGVSAALAVRLGLSHPKPLVPDCETMKFVVFVPPDYTDSVREAASAAGAGIIGNYSRCSFTTTGTGAYLPAEDATPFAGKPGELSRETEDRLEMLVPASHAARVVDAARDAHPYEEMAYDLVHLANRDSSAGYGAVGELDEPLERTGFLRMVRDRLNQRALRASDGGDGPVKRVAVLGGSGGHFISAARDAGAEAFVSGDLGHHDFLDYGDSLLLVDATHRATELPVLDTMAARLRARFRDIPIEVATGHPAFDDVRY